MATVSDALIVGEDFVSEHYFTSEAPSESFQGRVLARRKEWDAQRKEGADTVRSRYTAQRGELSAAFIGLAEESDAATLDSLYARLRALLGYSNALLWDTERFGGDPDDPDGTDAPAPAVAYRSRGLSGAAPFVIVEARAGLDVADLLAKKEKTLLREFHPTGDTAAATEPIVSAAGLLSHLFVSDDAPQFALVMAGSLALITERERWLEGRYIAVDLQLVGERNDTARGGEIDRALTLLSAESLASDAEGHIWFADVIAESVTHTVGVSKDLREGVRLSIELIANDVVQRRRAEHLDLLPDDQAQVLAGQSLRFLYRILFLLYAEATPELAVVPTGEPAYEHGYSLDRLRELLPVELVTHKARTGTHFYQSLGTLFRLVNDGHRGSVRPDVTAADDAAADGLDFEPLQADLFLPKATSLIDEVGLSNEALQRVLRHLLLSKEKRSRDRGFISYAELGINQLGAVYEGLMSYTGFFAHTTLYEVAKNGDASKGSWVVPADRIEGISSEHFVREPDEETGEKKPVVHAPGSFVFRLAGRERQQSASYYTPEVLTRFTVGQALEELLDQGGRTTTAEEILELTVCEPALGSGAFAIEAVRQLAEQYLTRRQNELGERIDPELYPAELQRVKAYLALHQVYGVDLNATAVEFAEISLWLDTMGRDLEAPWFGLHLRRGNSLIGARRALISAGAVGEKGWIDATPVDVPLIESPADKGLSGAVHHFLVPTSGWGSTEKAKEAKQLAPEALDEIKQWRRGLKKKPTKAQVRQLQALAQRTETLWGFSRKRLQIAESEIRRDIPLWGREHTPTGGAVTRKQIERSLADEAGAYRRLRRVMDAWCALWFWPLTDTDRTVDGEIASPPDVQEWIDALTELLGKPVKESPREKQGQANLFDVTDWDELGDAEETDLLFAQARNLQDVLDHHPWLVVAERIAQQQGFFHWEIDFSPAFERGGFDLQVGNPPWVRPITDVDALLAEGDPWFQLAIRPTRAEHRKRAEAALALPNMKDLVLSGTTDLAGIAAAVGDERTYPYLVGLQPDLYRCFMGQTWRHMSTHGIVALIHPESHLTDEKAGLLRQATYTRLRRHWQFINELKLYEVHDLVRYGVHVYGTEQDPQFLNASSLYHPETVTRSFDHDAMGPEPGIKNGEGKWDLRPHSARITTVDDGVLAVWRDLLENKETPKRKTRMVYTVNQSTSNVLRKLSDSDRFGSLPLQFSGGWHERGAREAGYFDVAWGEPDSWDDVIMHGAHIDISNPLSQYPNESMKHQQDWHLVDLEALAPNRVPTTYYEPNVAKPTYNAGYTAWVRTVEYGTESVPARSYYRLSWRNMAANLGRRTLFSSIIPPGAAHIHGMTSAGFTDGNERRLSKLAGITSSLISDFIVRIAPKSTINQSTIQRIPAMGNECITSMLILRCNRLNCLTDAYTDLWNKCFSEEMLQDSWAGGFAHNLRRPLGDVGTEWTADTPLRIDADRRQALVEIDALVALGLGLTADELCTIYRTQFPVLYGYDRNKYLYDANGRIVPQEVLVRWRKKGDNLTEDERTATHPAGTVYTYEPPFQFLDREADMREAYEVFSQRLGIEPGTPPAEQGALSSGDAAADSGKGVV